MPAAAPLVAAQPAPVTAHEPRRPTPAPGSTALGSTAPAASRPARETGPRPTLEKAGRTPAPVPVPRPEGKSGRKPSGAVAQTTNLTPTNAFDAVEADFFAREADLYRREAVENFDDLDHGTDDGSGDKPRPGAGGNKKR
jgi:hypothetical protein